MTTIRNLAMQWFNGKDTYNKSELSHKYYKETISYNFTSLTGSEIENIFYQEIIVKWWENLDSEYATSLIIKYFPNTTFDSFKMKEIYLKEHTKEQPKKEVAVISEANYIFTKIYGVQTEGLTNLKFGIFIPFSKLDSNELKIFHKLKQKR